MFLTGAGEVYGQIVLQGQEPFELEFTSVSISGDANHLRVNPASPSSRDILNSLFSSEEQRYSANPETDAGHFLLNLDQPYVGFRPGSEPEGDFLTFSVTNRSDLYIDQLRLSLDLAFQNRGERNVRLYQEYQLDSEAEYRNTGLIFNTNVAGNGNGEWETAALNLLLDDLLMGPDESLTVRIQWRSDPAGGAADGVAIQRMELNPVEYQFEQEIDSGDLVITEILPSLELGGNPYQYIEIYNRTMRSIDLKGIDLQAGGDLHRIRETLPIEPYGMVVIANRELPEQSVTPDYLLESLRIPVHGGVVDLIRNGQRLIRAAYDERDGNRSWELQQAVAAGNGYLSIGEFLPSSQRLDAVLNGSPGEAGSTERVFRYDPAPAGAWHLLSVPGRYISGDGAVYRIGLNQSGSATDGQVNTGEGFFLQPGIDEPISAREVPRVEEIRTQLTGNGEWQMLGNPFLHEMEMNRVRASGGELAGRVGQIWDASTGTFRLTTRQNGNVLPWQGFLIKNRNAESVEILREAETDEERDAIDQRERFIAFELSGSSQQSAFFDEAAILYFRGSDTDISGRYESEKLWPFFTGDPERIQSSLIYFQKEGVGESGYLAQQAFPYQPDASFEVRIGHVSLNTAGAFTLEWPEWINIPDLWEFTLIDHLTGAEVDMRQQENYRFESQPYRPESLELDPDEPAVIPLSGLPSGHRFSIHVNPGLSNVVEDEVLDEEANDQVTLYRNYPNPFSGTTTIRFWLPEDQMVSVSLFNVVGQRVALLLEDAPMSEGEHDLIWNAGDIPSGLYIIHLEAGTTVRTRKAILVK
ncbi:MAG: T9SS type A sorting domain-containing protein [Balneolaceae bacterium]